MILTACEFPFFATVTVLATQGRVAAHADSVCCAWLQVSTKYFKVFQTIDCRRFDRYSYLVWRNKNYKQMVQKKKVSFKLA